LRKARKMGVSRRDQNRKMSKIFSKKPVLPLEKEKRVMYNSPVVCLGMKW